MKNTRGIPVDRVTSSQQKPSIEFLTLKSEGVLAKVSSLLGGRDARVLRINDGESTFDINATRGLLMNPDGSYIEAKGDPDIDDMRDINVTLNPDKLAFISDHEGSNYDPSVILRDDKFVYAFDILRVSSQGVSTISAKIISMHPQSFVFLKRLSNGRTLFTDGENFFSNTVRLDKDKVNGVSGGNLYEDGMIILDSSSGLDLNTAKEISSDELGQAYFADSTGKVVYRYTTDRYSYEYVTLPEGIYVENFTPTGQKIDGRRFFTDGKSDYLTAHKAEYFISEKGTLGVTVYGYYMYNRFCSLDGNYIEVNMEEIPRLLKSGIIPQEMANSDSRVVAHKALLQEKIARLQADLAEYA